MKNLKSKHWISPCAKFEMINPPLETEMAMVTSQNSTDVLLVFLNGM